MKKHITILLAFLAICSATMAQEKADGELKTGYIPVSDGGVLYYEEKGQGEALIFLHGHTLDRRMWDDQFDEFAKEYRCIRFDFRGYGLSTDPREGYQFTHMDDALVVMDSLRVDKAHVIGLSMGGYVAGDMVMMCPERLLSCIMCSGNVCNFTGPSIPRSQSELRKKEADAALILKNGVEKYKRQRANSLVAIGGSHKERIRESVTRQVMDWRAWQPLHKTARIYYGADGWAKFRKTKPTVPALILTASKEYKAKKPAALAYLPNGSSQVIPDCGHMMNMERPDVFNDIVWKFLHGIKSKE